MGVLPGLLGCRSFTADPTAIFRLSLGLTETGRCRRLDGHPGLGTGLGPGEAAGLDSQRTGPRVWSGLRVPTVSDEVGSDYR